MVAAVERDQRAGLDQLAADPDVLLAVARGLLLDLLATHQRRAFDAAAEHFFDLLDRDLGPC